ncbi:cytochrome c oxidase assembly protein [Fictibacillus sp. Mic-4]|uniref:cytochrome c oxidase assembly protein n=1 Tax=Fictibacillus TaxID=1329200 RepID=UPI0004096F75|nr:cytochrome c oxidase assembly protein [Fictibacillus gelatini]
MHHHGLYHHLSDYGFVALYGPDILLLAIVLAVVYFKYFVPKGVKTSQKVLFILALIFMYIAEGSPLSVLGHHFSFTAHMAQMAIMYLVFPPLIILSLPVSFYKTILEKENGFTRFFRAATKPLIALVSFVMLFSFYHIPGIFDFVMANMPLMTLYHMVLLLASFITWWPALCPVEEYDDMSGIKRIAYIFGSGLLLTPACALIMFANRVLFTTYMDAPRVFFGMSPLEDQIAGGVVMKIMQEFVYAVILGVIFFRWVRRQKERDEEETARIEASILAFQNKH